MKTYDFCKKMSASQKIAIDRYARRLGEGEDRLELTIHKDGSIDIMCANGGICENYRPSAQELRLR